MDDPCSKPIQFDAVADLYDSYVHADFDVPFWLREARAVRGRVLELTCGTGRVSLPLLEAGVSLTCVDYSPGMLAVLRQKLETRRISCPLVCQDMAELDLANQFDLVIIPFHSFSEIVDTAKHRRALERIRVHLADHGRLIVSLQNPVVRAKSIDGTLQSLGTFLLDGGRTLKVHSRLTFNESTRIAEGDQFYEVRETDGAVIDERRLGIRFYLFSHGEFGHLVRSAGFMVNAVYGDYAGAPFDEATSPFMLWDMTS